VRCFIEKPAARPLFLEVVSVLRMVQEQHGRQGAAG
jgi:hypothetical protein